VRLLGVRGDRVAEPTEQVETQPSLFEVDETGANTDMEPNWDSTDQILDDVAKKFPGAAIKPASLLRHERTQRMSDS